MALARIKNPEQLKQCKPGEIGRVIGLDRIPEVRCLRDKIKILSQQKKSKELNNRLINHWYDFENEDAGFLYIEVISEFIMDIKQTFRSNTFLDRNYV